MVPAKGTQRRDICDMEPGWRSKAPVEPENEGRTGPHFDRNRPASGVIPCVGEHVGPPEEIGEGAEDRHLDLTSPHHERPVLPGAEIGAKVGRKLNSSERFSPVIGTPGKLAASIGEIAGFPFEPACDSGRPPAEEGGAAEAKGETARREERHAALQLVSRSEIGDIARTVVVETDSLQRVAGDDSEACRGDGSIQRNSL